MLFDEKQLKNHFDGDDELIGELVEVFEATYPATLDSVKTAVSSNNYKDLELHAHTLKGMISNFFAEELRVASLELEQMARSENITSPEERINTLEIGLPKLVVELKSII